MLMKQCTKCKEEKPLVKFYKNKEKKFNRSSWCKLCDRERHRTREQAAKDWLNSIKEEQGCVKCGVSDGRVLEFHHRKPAMGDRCVSMLLSYSKKVVREEMTKCDILCVNCHRLAHDNAPSIRKPQKSQQATYVEAIKTCSRCGEEKRYSQFSKRSDRPSGRHPWCKVCMKQYDQERQ